MTIIYRQYALPPPRVPDRRVYFKELRSIALCMWYILKWICRIWRYILIYIVTLICVYGIVFFGSDIITIHLNKLVSYGIYGQFLFCLGMYWQLANEKHKEAKACIPSVNILVNTLKLMNIDNNDDSLMVLNILSLTYTLVFMTFFCLSPMVRSNVLRGPEKTYVHVLINSTLSMVSSSTLSQDISEVKSMMRALASGSVDKARHIVEPLRTDVNKEISALQQKCDKYVLMGQNVKFNIWTIAVQTSMWFCNVVFALDLFSAAFDGNHDLMTKCTSIAVSTIICFVIFLPSAILVKYLEQIVSPYNSTYDLFDLNQNLNEKLSEMNDHKTYFALRFPNEIFDHLLSYRNVETEAYNNTYNDRRHHVLSYQLKNKDV